MVNTVAYEAIKRELDAAGITLVAVSKTKPEEDILELYQLGQRDFGENYVQELVEKAAHLPRDIRWHFIGHLQTNKVKLIAPFVQLVHGVDSLKLLKEINKEAGKQGRVIDCLLQVFIAQEETKFGLDETELASLLNELTNQPLSHVQVCGLMGMASFTDDSEKVRMEFRQLRTLFEKYNPGTWTILSMGMSSDYAIAAAEGSTLVRIGSLLFGERQKK
ncbi:MAG: YggS family pyridoxal phosphate-dependent enzyme [Bacteroidetes bacterium]|nr:YggS family pyridoxal phosphate-dependent enzyme [Bacteroidota bacterium]